MVLEVFPPGTQVYVVAAVAFAVKVAVPPEHIEAGEALGAKVGEAVTETVAATAAVQVPLAPSKV